MKYINKKIFDYAKTNDEETEYFGWILTGIPTLETLLGNKKDNAAAQSEYNGDNGIGNGKAYVQNEISENDVGDILFYDSYIAGYSPLIEKAINFNFGAFNGPLNINFSGTNSAKINLIVDSESASSIGWKSNNCYLFFVKYKKDIEGVANKEDLETKIEEFFNEIYTGDNNNTPNINKYYYKNTVENYTGEEDKNLSTLIKKKDFVENFIDKIYISYYVNTSSVINAYNFSGFSVGDSTLSINGFYGE